MSTREDALYSRMRKNVTKQVRLDFSHYEIRVEADVKVNYQLDSYKTILPTIKISYLKRCFIRDEVLLEIRKIKGIIEADVHLEVFAVYNIERAIGDYKRYLGELFMFMSNIPYDNTKSSYKASKAYFEQPEKSDFIPEGI